MNSSGIIMLLIIAGIGFIWYLLYEDREKTAKKNEGKDEFQVLLDTTEVPEEDKDVYLDKNKTDITEDEYTHEIPTTPEEAINNSTNVVIEENETPQVSTKNKKNKKSRKSNKK